MELCEEAGYRIVGIVDSNVNPLLRDYNWLGDDNSALEKINSTEGLAAVISPDIPKARKRIYSLYASKNLSFPPIVSPQANVSRWATIREGAVIQAGANISAGTNIGRFSKINCFGNLMHDSSTGDFTTVAPNAVILGGVQISDEAYIGANCTILPTLSIGKGAIVGAGAVVTKNVGSNTIVAGVPAKTMDS